jgi:hypothetical protein
VVVARLRAQVAALENRRAEQIYPAPEALASLLPEGGLKPGAAYSVATSGALLLAMLASASGEGLWCGLVGLPNVGVEAAKLAGVTLDRLALVPDPGAKWLSAVSVLSSAVPVVAVRPSGPVRPGDAARLATRMRDNESVLLVVGSWPGAEATISVTDSMWAGLGQGWGHLTEHEVTVQVASKRYPRPRRVQMLLPGADGRAGGGWASRESVGRSGSVLGRLDREGGQELFESAAVNGLTSMDEMEFRPRMVAG